MRNRLVRSLTALTLAAALLAGCAGGAKKGAAIPEPVKDAKVDTSKLSKELNLFAWTEYMPQEVLDTFEKLYGVKVYYDTYSSNEELHAKLKAGGGGYDVVIPEIYMIKALKREGLLEKIDTANLTNLSNLDDRFRGLPHDPKNEYSVPYMWGTTGIVINTEKIKPEQIKSWNDLWKPEFKGRLVMPDDAREMIGMALRAGGHSLNTTDKAALEKAKERLMALKPNVKAYNSDSPKDLILGGEVWGGFVWNGEAALLIREDSKKYQYILPPEGVTLWVDNLAIPKGAPHKYTAEVFINYLLDPAVSARLSAEFPYGNPNKAAQQYLPEADRKNPAINPPAEWLKKAESLEDLGDEMNQVYDQIWTEIKG